MPVGLSHPGLGQRGRTAAIPDRQGAESPAEDDPPCTRGTLPGHHVAQVDSAVTTFGFIAVTTTGHTLHFPARQTGLLCGAGHAIAGAAWVEITARYMAM